MQWSDLLNRPRPTASLHIPYGADSLQFAELWLPAGRGPHPLVIMVHGGCWQSDVASAGIMNYLAEDLRAHGIAVWNIEYRGVDRLGGGYPGTFTDLADAVDAVRRQAKKHALRLDHVVIVGHSAGGHLALWAAARGGIQRTSQVWRPRPLAIQSAFSLGGLPDLEAAQTPGGDTCGADTVQRLVGQPTPRHPSVFADTSPAVMALPGARITLVNATRDRIAPPSFATAYAKKMGAKGAALTLHTIADEGHVELIAPGSQSWTLTRSLIETEAR